MLLGHSRAGPDVKVPGFQAPLAQRPGFLQVLSAQVAGLHPGTQGGESLAGLRQALGSGLLKSGDRAVLDSTAHTLKFAQFQDMYFEDAFGPEFEIMPREEYQNRPSSIIPPGLKKLPQPGTRLEPEEMRAFIEAAAREIAQSLGLRPKS